MAIPRCNCYDYKASKEYKAEEHQTSDSAQLDVKLFNKIQFNSLPATLSQSSPPPGEHFYIYLSFCLSEASLCVLFLLCFFGFLHHATIANNEVESRKKQCSRIDCNNRWIGGGCSNLLALFRDVGEDADDFCLGMHAVLLLVGLGRTWPSSTVYHSHSASWLEFFISPRRCCFCLVVFAAIIISLVIIIIVVDKQKKMYDFVQCFMVKSFDSCCCCYCLLTDFNMLIFIYPGMANIQG